MILPCTCHHVYQDRLYGHGQRVHNRAPKAGGYRCTVCGKVRTAAGATPTARYTEKPEEV